MKEILRKLLFCSLPMLCLCFGFQNITEAQNAPITTISNVGNAIPNQQVYIPITVTNFDSIGSISLTIDYNYGMLHYVSGTVNPLLNGSINIGDNDLGGEMHRLIIGWYGYGTSLPDSSWILNLVFTYITGTPTLQWFDDGPSCLYTDEEGNMLNDSPTSTYYINGFFCATLQSPDPISGLSSACQGTTDVVYSTNLIPNTLGYSWTVPAGALITSPMDTNIIIVNFSSSATSGNITVGGINACGNSTATSLPITIYAHPVADAGTDTTIMYNASASLHAASGGTGTFSYYWSPDSLLVEDDIKDPQTIQLTSSATFSLIVTNLVTQCQDSSNVVVAVLDSTLTGYPSIEESNFKIYPNPAKDHFTINILNPQAEIISLKIFTGEGILIKDIKINERPESHEYMINTKEMAKGIYYLNIETEFKNITRKLIIL